VFNLDLPYTDGTKAAAVIWGIAWRMTTALLGCAAVLGFLGLAGCALGKPDDIATPNETTRSEAAVFPLCVLSTVGVSETYFAVADTIGSAVTLLHTNGVLADLPDTDRLNKSVGAATDVFLSNEENQSVKAGDMFMVCVSEEGLITSVDNMDVPAL
jgi:uncharacterized membrane protein